MSKKKKLKNVTLYLTGVIDTDTVEPVIKEILEMNNSEREHRIHLIINSPGGSVTAGNALIDVINFSKHNIYGTGIGQICSMAVYILASCHSALATPNTIFMIHKVSTFAYGGVNDMLNTVKVIKQLEKPLHKILTQKRLLDPDLLQRKLDSNLDWYLTAKEAKKLNIIDGIIGKVTC